MKKLLTIAFLFISVFAVAQKGTIPPTGTTFKTIQSPYWKIDTSKPDSAIWMYASSLYGWVNLMSPQNVGVIVLPTITRVGDGSIIIGGDGLISINSEASGRGRNESFNVPSATLIPTDNGVSFIYADYNNGSPIYQITTNRDQFLTNFTLIPVIRVSREGTIVHFLEYDEYGVQLANKMNLKDIFISGFQRESGLILSTAEGRISTVSAGRVVFSVQWWNMAANIAGIAGDLYEYYRVGGAWNRTLVTSYDATYYCDGVNRLTLSNNQFVSKYFFRDAGDDNEVYYIHGNTYNKFSDALAEPLPPAPEIITSHSIYVGKIVVQKGATNGTAFPRAWDTALEKNASQRHGDLSQLTWNESGHVGELNSVAGFDSLGLATYVGLDTIQFARDTLTWDATKKDLRDFTAYLKTLIQQAEARFPNFASSIQSMTGTQDTLIMTPLMVYEMIQMLSIQPYGEEEDLYLKGRKITSDSLIVDGIRADNGQVELLGNLQISDTLKVERIQLVNGYTEGYYLKIGANGNVEVSAISGAMVYKGTWDASTNTPTLADGTGTNGWYYRVVTGGTQNLGSGNITFSAGDDVLYDGAVWQRVPSPTYSLQPATATTLGGVKIGSNINVTEDGTISTHAQQNIFTNGLAGNISISNGSTLNLNVNDADASATNEIQALSFTKPILSIALANSVDLSPLISGIRDTLIFHSDSLQIIFNSIDTLTTSLYDSIVVIKADIDSLNYKSNELKDSLSFYLLSSIFNDTVTIFRSDLNAINSTLNIVRDSVSLINDSLSYYVLKTQFFDSLSVHNSKIIQNMDSIRILDNLFENLSDSLGFYVLNTVFLDSISDLRSKITEIQDTTYVYKFNGRSGNVVPQSGDYTTTQITEGTNLYYISSRVQAEAIGGDLTGTISNAQIVSGAIQKSDLNNDLQAKIDTISINRDSIETLSPIIREFESISDSLVKANSDFGVTNRLIKSDGTGKTVQASGITVDGSNNIVTSGKVTHGIPTLPTHSALVSTIADSLLNYTKTIILNNKFKSLSDSLSIAYDSIFSHNTRILGLKIELTNEFDTKLSDSVTYLETMIQDSILRHRTEIDSLKEVTENIQIETPTPATTLETVTSTENEDYVTPKTLKEFLELSYVPYYGSNEDIYTKKITADSLILRDLTGEGIRAVAVNSKGKLIDTLLVFDDISELSIWNKGQSDSIKGLLYWNQIQSDSLKIIADSLAFYVVTGDDSIQAHRLEIEALKDSIFDHRTELEIIKDTLVAHNLRLITLEGKNYILFSDTLDLIGTKYDIEEARFTNSDEIDPIYSQDSIKIVWFKDLKPIQDSLKTVFDTLGVHNTRLLVLEIDTAYWNNKVSQEELADSTWLLRDLIRHAKVEKSDNLKALTGSNDLTYISPEKLVEVIKMLSFQNFGQLEDVYAPTITLTVDSLKVGLIDGEAFIESGTLKSKVSSTNFTGLINGVNKTFTLEGIPKYLDVYLNGVYQVLNKDFTLSGTSVIFVKVPYSTDEITIKYTK